MDLSLIIILLTPVSNVQVVAWESPRTNLNLKSRRRQSTIERSQEWPWIQAHQKQKLCRNCLCKFASSRMLLNVFCMRLTSKRSSTICVKNVANIVKNLYIFPVVGEVSISTTISKLMNWSTKLTTMTCLRSWLLKRDQLPKLWSR